MLAIIVNSQVQIKEEIIIKVLTTSELFSFSFYMIHQFTFLIKPTALGGGLLIGYEPRQFLKAFDRPGSYKLSLVSILNPITLMKFANWISLPGPWISAHPSSLHSRKIPLRLDSNATPKSMPREWGCIDSARDSAFDQCVGPSASFHFVGRWRNAPIQNSGTARYRCWVRSWTVSNLTWLGFAWRFSPSILALCTFCKRVCVWKFYKESKLPANQFHKELLSVLHSNIIAITLSVLSHQIVISTNHCIAMKTNVAIALTVITPHPPNC